jgi:hypothetical protein
MNIHNVLLERRPLGKLSKLKHGLNRVVAMLSWRGAPAQSWNPLSSGTLATLNSIAIVVGENGTLLRTDDGGGSCQAVALHVVFNDGFESGHVAMWSSAAP